MGCRCFWDADTDNYADESYRNVRGCRSRAARAASARPPHASACPGAAGAPLTDELFRARRTRSFASRPPSGCTCTKRNSHARHRIRLARASPLARPSLSPVRGDSVVFPTSRHCVPHPRACCSFTIKLLSGAKSDTHTNTLCTSTRFRSAFPIRSAIVRSCASTVPVGQGGGVEDAMWCS